MAKALDLDKLFTLIPRMQEAVKRYDLILEGVDPIKYEQWRKAQSRAEDRLIDLITMMGGEVRKRPAVDYAVILAGVRSTSTAGLSAACSNWIQSAAQKTGCAHG